VPFNGRTIIDTDGVYMLQDLPKRLAIVGAGVIGVEYACIFAALGIDVTLVEQRDEMLDFIDEEIREALSYHMREAGITFRFREEVAGVSDEGHRIVARTRSRKTITADHLLYAGGRQGNTDTLNLASAGLEADRRGRLKVNEQFQTEAPHIYACGDVIGFPALAASSMEQGRLAARHAFGEGGSFNSNLFPYGIYTIPETSMVGQTEKELSEAGIPYEIGVARYREIARGQIIGDSNGLVKLLIHADDRSILGVHLLGTGASELVHIGQTAMALGGTLDFFVENVFNYPTLAECYKVAALDAYNKLA
jgi:NAD(P) transhydrogenase